MYFTFPGNADIQAWLRIIVFVDISLLNAVSLSKHNTKSSSNK